MITTPSAPSPLDPASISKFASPLLIPPVMPRAGAPAPGGQQFDYYEISMRQFSQQILPADLPKTTVWGYGPAAAMAENAVKLHNAPSLTIEARAGVPTRVKWINELKNDKGGYLPHLLAVDPTLHWANPPGGEAERDTRPVFDKTPSAYTGPVPIVTHVHGAVGVGDESDGYAESWFLPDADDIPSGYADRGTWFDFLAGKAKSGYGADWAPGFAIFQYPNANRASTLWYHDHALGMTRLNVYAGPAGFFIVRGGDAGDEAVVDSRTGAPAVLPGPAPKEGDKFPSDVAYYEIPVAIQDRASGPPSSSATRSSRMAQRGRSKASNSGATVSGSSTGASRASSSSTSPRFRA
jgi:FtsP/CotA-like multicopper oxidase with cupredoxin domain